jgi:LETM1 and EF-hand domain-containing protein 1
MLTKLDAQLQAYDERVGSSLQLIACDPQGRVSLADVTQALGMIKHAPGEDVIAGVVHKLDPDRDGFVELEHVLGLVRDEGLGVEGDEEVRRLVGEGREIRKPRKEDIVSE